MHWSLVRRGGREMVLVMAEDPVPLRWKAIQESLDDGMVGTTWDGSIVSWNPGAERIYGCSSEESRGCSVAILFPGSSKRRIARLWKRVQAGETVEHFEQGKGGAFSAMLRLNPVKDSANRVRGAFILVRDMAERKQWEAEVLKGSEWEQQRMGQDLHDGLGQHLAALHCRMSALRLNLERKRSSEAGEARQIGEIINQAVKQMRNLARGLYPVRPEPNGFMAAMQNLVVWVQDAFGIDCQFLCRKAVLLEDYNMGTHLYRIAQEAITNACKHGQAARIRVVLSEGRGNIILRVADDGIGIAEAHGKEGGLGLRLMRSRAEMIGASLAIERLPRGGTEVICRIKKRR